MVIGKKIVKNYVTLKRVLAQTWVNLIAGITKFRRIGQHSKGIVQAFQVMPPLYSSPTFFGKTGYTAQVILSSVSKRKCTH